MYRIALCDDEPTELENLSDMLAAYCALHTECRFSVEPFLRADEMLRRMSEENYAPDLLLLDIYMQGRLGTEVAAEIRETGKNCEILFITSSKEHALEAFHVNALQYLVKPVQQEDLFPVLDRFIKGMGASKKYLLFRDNGMRRVAAQDIVYCEAQKKCQCIYLSDGTQLIQSMTMARVYEMLSVCEEFVKVGVSYIVNLAYINKLNARELQLDNGKIIYLPRGAYRGLREQYFDYYCGEDGDGYWTTQ